jgi:hypothetical protein
MTDNLKPAAPARFYGFAHTRTIAENLAALKAFEEAACTEVLAGGEAECARTEVPVGGGTECAPSASTDLVRAPRDKQAPSAAVQAVIEAILAQPPLGQQTPEPQPIREEKCRARRHARRKLEGKLEGKRLKKKRRRPKAVAEEPQLPSPAMHEAQCMICNSEWREEIDELFVNWHNVSEIGREYNTPRRTVYRHAHAVGLFPIRDRNLRRSLGLIIHRAETAPCLTVDSVIRAVRTLAHINETGEWVNPPTHVIVSSGAAVHANTIVPSSPELLDTPCQAIESVKP